MDKQSGKDFNHPQYQKFKKKLREGDVLVVKSIDRLGRNYEEIQTECQQIVKEIKADIVVLDMPILDTRTNKDFICTLISDIVLQLLSCVAQAERENIRQRQAEGIATARARGVHIGRFPDPIPDDFPAVYKDWAAKRITRKKTLGVSFNKIFAKLGSDCKTPDAVTVYTQDNFKERIWPLPVSDLLYEGRATTKKLMDRGVETIGLVANDDLSVLQAWFGKIGLILSCFANGYDTSPVMRYGDETIIMSIGNSNDPHKRVRQIVVTGPNNLRYDFADGHTFEQTWKDHSRSESWTDDMREAA